MKRILTHPSLRNYVLGTANARALLDGLGGTIPYTPSMGYAVDGDYLLRRMLPPSRLLKHLPTLIQNERDEDNQRREAEEKEAKEKAEEREREKREVEERERERDAEAEREREREREAEAEAERERDEDNGMDEKHNGKDGKDEKEEKEMEDGDKDDSKYAESDPPRFDKQRFKRYLKWRGSVQQSAFETLARDAKVCVCVCV